VALSAPPAPPSAADQARAAKCRGAWCERRHRNFSHASAPAVRRHNVRAEQDLVHGVFEQAREVGRAMHAGPLRETGAAFAVSIMSNTPETHDQTTGRSGSWNSTTSNVRQMIPTNRVRASISVFPHTETSLPEPWETFCMQPSQTYCVPNSLDLRTRSWRLPSRAEIAKSSPAIQALAAARRWETARPHVVRPTAIRPI